MDNYTILCTELRGSAQGLKGNIEKLQKKADKLQKAINKVTRGDYKASDLSSAYTAQSTLAGSITRLGEICGAMNTAALQFSEASAELSGRANLTAYYMQHTDTLSYEGLMGTYSAAIASAGSAVAGYELIKDTLEDNGYSVGGLGSVSNAVQDAIQREAEEQAKRDEEAKWAKIGLTGLVIVGGIVASVATGGAAAPIVIGAISGAVMAGGNTAIDQYAEHGWNMDNWNYAEIGKDAFVGGITGATTAWIGGNLTKGVTNFASNTQWGSTLLNSSSAYVRVGTGVFIGSASEVASGVGTRGAETFITTMVETEGDIGKSLTQAKDAALDGKQMIKDVVFGGAQGGYGEYQKMKPDYVDWNNTANSNEELETLREMEANGDFAGEDYDYSSVEIDPEATGLPEPSRRMPTENTGTIIGNRDSGTFDFVPHDADVREMMGKYGQESIHIQDGHADFKPFTKQKTEWGEIDCEVEIGYMSTNRDTNVAGPRTSNYAQADDALALKISEQTGISVTGTEVQKFRENGFTWHELEDRTTMQLVPTKIHDSARHSGGIAQAKYEMSWGNVAIDDGVSRMMPRADAEPDLVNYIIDAGSEVMKEILD